MYESETQIKEFRNIHSGKVCLVCGMGPSLKTILGYPIDKITTIGISDINVIFTPTYQIQAHSHSRDPNYPDETWNKKVMDILDSDCKTIFSLTDNQYKVPYILTRMRSLRWGEGINSIMTRDRIPGYMNTICLAIGLALYMGFGIIGVIGMDYTGERANCPSSDNILKFVDSRDSKVTANMTIIDFNAGVAKYEDYARQNGIDIFNLSDVSLITAFRKITPELFFDTYVRQTSQT